MEHTVHDDKQHDEKHKGNAISAPTVDSDMEIGASRLDALVADFTEHVRRLSTLDVAGVTNADVVAELRDNAYPSLLILAEEIREIDAELADVSEPDVSLEPEHALAIATALRAGQDLAKAVRDQMAIGSSESDWEKFVPYLDRFDSQSRVAAEMLHGLVTVDDDHDFDTAGSE